MIAQLETGTRGSMVGVDQALADKEKRATQRKIGVQTRRRKIKDGQQASCSTAELIHQVLIQQIPAQQKTVTIGRQMYRGC